LRAQSMLARLRYVTFSRREVVVRAVTLGTLNVSAQGLGCMGMSEHYGPTDWEASVATIGHALERGITLFDTADIYGAGHNEVLLGRALASRHDEAVIATKFGVDRSSGDDRRTVRGDRRYVHRCCDASLLRLGIDHIDLYYMHRPPQNVPIEETVNAMGELVKAGKVGHLGLCEVDEDQLRRAHAVHPITAVQSEYSLFSRDVEDLASVLGELNVGLVAYSPLGRGFLSGAIDLASLTANDSRRGHPRFQGENAATNQRLVAELAALATEVDASPAQLALAWVHHRSSVLDVPVVPIPGTRRSERVDANVAALELSVDASMYDDLELLGRQVAGSRLGTLQNVHGGSPAESRR
jgi:aryl-alcohol dehydrogenase-like predicted oxidoreductase